MSRVRRMFDQLQNLDSSFTHGLQVEPLGAILGCFPTWKNNTKALQRRKLEYVNLPEALEHFTWNLFAENGKRDDCGSLSQTISASGLYSPDPIGPPQGSPLVACRVRPSPVRIECSGARRIVLCRIDRELVYGPAWIPIFL